MTVQMDDRLVLEGQEYAIHGISLEDCPLPGLRRYMGLLDQTFSACWRGHRCEWEIRDDRLVLVDVMLFMPEDQPTVTLREALPGHPNGVQADWFSGKIELPRGCELDLGEGFAMYEETLVLTLCDGRLMQRRIVDNLSAAAAAALRIQEQRLSVKKAAQRTASASRATAVLPLEESEEPDSAVELECEEFMLAAMMGTVDDEVLRQWRAFHARAIGSANPRETLLLEVVDRVMSTA